MKHPKITRALTAQSASSAGPRPRNEDRTACWERSGAQVIAIADGMGGYGDGDVAAQLAIDVVEGCLPAPLDPELARAWMRDTFRMAGQRVLAYARTGGSHGMGTTLLVGLLLPDRLLLGHLGDSRAYSIGTSELRLLTRDHSVGHDAVARGLISGKDIGSYPHADALLRSLGTEPESDVELIEHPLSMDEGETGLLLCTDGVWNAVPEDVMFDKVTDMAGRVRSDGAEALVAEAERRQTSDNASAVLLRIADPSEPPRRGARLLLFGLLGALVLILLIRCLPTGLYEEPLLEGRPATSGGDQPNNPDAARQIRTIWIRTSLADGLSATLHSSPIGQVAPGQLLPIRVLPGDSLWFIPMGNSIQPAILEVVGAETPDTLHVPSSLEGSV